MYIYIYIYIYIYSVGRQRVLQRRKTLTRRLGSSSPSSSPEFLTFNLFVPVFRIYETTKLIDKNKEIHNTDG